MKARELNDKAIDAFNKQQFKDAEIHFKKAIALEPKYAEAYANLGALYAKFKKYDEAIKLYEHSIKLKPSYAGAYTNLGNALNKIKRYEEAVFYHKAAISLDPKAPNHYSNCASAYKNLGRFDQAKKLYLKAIELNPKHVNAHFDLATLYLQTGLYKQGWEHYEWRFKKEEMAGHVRKYRKIFEAPRYTLEAPKGTKVLVHVEQGYGDTLMVARYLYELKASGAYVILYLRKGLRELFETFKCVDEIYLREETEPSGIDFETQLPFMSLPYLFDPKLKNVAKNYPYIKVRKKYGLKSKKIKIGIVWGASNTGESYTNKVFDLRHFRLLSNDNRFILYSLQMGKDAEDLKRYNMKNVEDLSEKIDNFLTTAQMINDLDLVITSDTSVAHLAGAMGKEVWIVLQKVADWRWGVCGEKSIWYPSAKLFFQHSVGDFNSAFRQVYQALQEKYNVSIKGIDE